VQESQAVDLAEGGLQLARLTGENERRKGRQKRFHFLQRRLVGVVRHLDDRF